MGSTWFHIDHNGGVADVPFKQLDDFTGVMKKLNKEKFVGNPREVQLIVSVDEFVHRRHCIKRIRTDTLVAWSFLMSRSVYFNINITSTTLQLQSVPNQMREELGNEKFKVFVGTFWLTRLEAPSGSVGSGQVGCF